MKPPIIEKDHGMPKTTKTLKITRTPEQAQAFWAGLNTRKHSDYTIFAEGVVTELRELGFLNQSIISTDSIRAYISLVFLSNPRHVELMESYPQDFCEMISMDWNGLVEPEHVKNLVEKHNLMGKKRFYARETIRKLFGITKTTPGLVVLKTARERTADRVRKHRREHAQVKPVKNPWKAMNISRSGYFQKKLNESQEIQTRKAEIKENIKTVRSLRKHNKNLTPTFKALNLAGAEQNIDYTLDGKPLIWVTRGGTKLGISISRSKEYTIEIFEVGALVPFEILMGYNAIREFLEYFEETHLETA